MAVAGMIGKKIGMTQVFDENGEIHPITVVQVGPCVITQMKTQAKDGYDAAQIGLVEFVKSSKINKAMAGHFGKSNVPPVRILREVPIEAAAKAAEGEEIVGQQGRRSRAGGYFRGREICRCAGHQQGARIRRRGTAARIWRRTEIARTHVPGARIDRRFFLSFAGNEGNADAGSHGRG